MHDTYRPLLACGQCLGTTKSLKLLREFSGTLIRPIEIIPTAVPEATSIPNGVLGWVLSNLAMTVRD